MPSARGRSQVVVETLRVGTSEAGDVIRAIAEGHLVEADLVTTRGMGWQDLAVASLLGGSA